MAKDRLKALVISANPKSKVFYTRMKGELDDAVQKLGFEGCFILRPPSLIRLAKSGRKGVEIIESQDILRA